MPLRGLAPYLKLQSVFSGPWLIKPLVEAPVKHVTPSWVRPKDTITRFWCAVEIVSAHKNNVPILVSLLGDVSETLTDDFQKRIQWSDDEAAAFTALGISVTEVREALKALSSSPLFTLYPTSTDVVLELELEKVTLMGQ